MWGDGEAGRGARTKKRAPKCSRQASRPGGQGRGLRGPAIAGIPQAENQAFASAENRLRYNHLTCPVGYTHWITSFLVYFLCTIMNARTQEKNDGLGWGHFFQRREPMGAWSDRAERDGESVGT